MELEALLLGIEPIVALGVGIGALLIAPVIGSFANPEIGKSVSDSGRSLTKNGIKLGFEALDKVQTTFAEASESFNDLFAEAKSEVEAKRNGAQLPREVEIVEDHA